MPITFDVARQHAYQCAMADACTTAEFAARALDCSLESARSALKLAAEAGYLRALLTPGLGNKLCYQPTPKAAGVNGQPIPKFLRAGLSPEGRCRGVLRGYVRFAARPELSYLPASEQAALCQCYAIPDRGHARALVGLDGPQAHIFVSVLKAEKSISAIEAAADRWLPLLESGKATMHFIALAGASADAVRATLAILAPPLVDGRLHAELAILDATIASDRSGLAVLKLAAGRAALVAELEATKADGADHYPWLGNLVEAAL